MTYIAADGTVRKGSPPQKLGWNPFAWLQMAFWFILKVVYFFFTTMCEVRGRLFSPSGHTGPIVHWTLDSTPPVERIIYANSRAPRTTCCCCHVCSHPASPSHRVVG